jgi:hypothetical protein
VTTYRLFPATNGPSSPVTYTGAFRCGVLFKVTQGGMLLSGYWKWVATGEDTVARTFALWAVTGAAAGTNIAAATVTSGTLTAGQWNFVALATPVPLAIGTAYNACTGWTAVSGHGFSDSDTTGTGTGAGDSYGTGGHTAGITQGPLFAFSDGAGGGGTKGEPYGNAQGVFDTSASAVTASAPWTGSASGNFWMDVSVTDVTPPGYSGTYRLYPNKPDSNSATVPDASVNYSVATEFSLSQASTLSKIWYYSPAGTAQLATSCRIWTITGANSGSSVVTNTSPSWSGAAGSGWVSCSFAGVTLQPGAYKASVYNGQASPDGWSAKDASTTYWGTGGDGVNGITWGPLTAPGLSTASLAYKFFGASPGSTPPYTDGVTTERGQCTFVNGNGDFYPYLYVDALAQNYWLDVEVTPAPVLAGPAAGTGTAQPPGPVISAAAGLAAGTGTAQPPGHASAAVTSLAAGTGTGQPPPAALVPVTGLAGGAGTAPAPVPVAVPGITLAAGAGTAQPPSVASSSNITVLAGLARALAAALPPPVTGPATGGHSTGTAVTELASMLATVT